MDALDPNAAINKLGLITRALIWIAGGDQETARYCPAHDIQFLCALGLLALANVCFEAGVRRLVAHRLFAPDGTVHAGLVIGSISVAIFIYLIDLFVFYRAGHHADGIVQLRHAGVDLGGNFFAKVKRAIVLGLRILVLSLGLALLTGIFVGIIIFRSDISADNNRLYQQQNAPLIKEATLRIDTQIQQTTAAVDHQETYVKTLQGEVAAMRQGVVAPTANDPAVRAAQQEVDRLKADKAQKDAALEASRNYAADEEGGIKGTRRNSGIAGRGPRWRAAEERVQSATANDAAAGQALTVARARLDDLSRQSASTAGDRSQESRQQLPQTERDLGVATVQLTTLRDNLAKLTDGREADIRKAVESAPDTLGRDDGLIGQINALRRIAQDPEVAAVIGLIDVTAFGLELAAVLGKVMTFIPTTYAALLAKNAYLGTLKIADEIEAALNERSPEPPVETELFPPIVDTDDDGEDTGASPEPEDGSSPLVGPIAGKPNGHDPDDPPPPPPKRPRGRPRKNPPM